jgi:hypothetical protein
LAVDPDKLQYIPHLSANMENPHTSGKNADSAFPRKHLMAKRLLKFSTATNIPCFPQLAKNTYPPF